MRKLVLFMVMFLALSMVSQAGEIIVQYDFEDTADFASGGHASDDAMFRAVGTAAGTVKAGVTAGSLTAPYQSDDGSVGFDTDRMGITASVKDHVVGQYWFYRGNSVEATTEAGAVTAQEYLMFTIDPGASPITVGIMEWAQFRENGNVTFFIQTSLDGFASTVASYTGGPADDGVRSMNLGITLPASTTTEIRLYMYDNNSTNNVISRIDNITLQVADPITVTAEAAGPIGQVGSEYGPVDATIVTSGIETVDTITWSKVSGPGAVTFIPNANVEDPNVTFSAGGDYVLQVTATATPSAASDSDTISVYVDDPADNQQPLAHWNFEGIDTDPNILDISGNGYHAAPSISDPNTAAGVLNSGTSVALDTRPDTGKLVTGTVNAPYVGDPNFLELQGGWTVAAWLQVPESGAGYYSRVIHFGDDRLQINNKTISMDAGPYLEASRALIADNWHHVVAIHDPIAGLDQLYIDGRLYGEAAATYAASDLSELVHILDDPDVNPSGDRAFEGLMDDLRLYNYPLPQSEIDNLVAQGNVKLHLWAGNNQEYVNVGDFTFVDESAYVIDDGKLPDFTTEAAAITWAQIDGPEGDPNQVTFVAGADTLSPMISFPAGLPGDYRFEITLANSVETETDIVVISVVEPTCEQALADGYGNYFDVAGGTPDGEGNPTPDCRVNLEDFVVFAAEWLDCIDPQGGIGCTNPYANP